LHPSFLASLGQEGIREDKSLPKANAEYGDSKFSEAEANYRISNSKFPSRTIASYNLGIPYTSKIKLRSKVCICKIKECQNETSKT
jgi:hypothetical protein